MGFWLALRILSYGLLAASFSIAAADTLTITTARRAHSLSLEEATRHHPVHLTGVVTYYDPYIDPRHAALFVHDATGDIFVSGSSGAIRPGMLVDVAGVSAAGDFAPIVDRGQVRIIGQSHIPVQAPRVSLTELLTGQYDGHWVEVQGVVHSFREFGRNVNLDLAMSDGSLTATTLKEPGADYSRLVDAKIRLHANAAPIFNGNGLMVGTRLLFPDLTQIAVEEPPVADPFAQPVLPVNGLLRYTPNMAMHHRVHVRGLVSLQWPGRSLCIQSEDGGLCVQTAQTAPVPPGELVDIVGFPAIGVSTPTLKDATFRFAGRGQPPFPLPIAAEQALSSDKDAKLVEIEGKLIGKDRAAMDPTLVLGSGKSLFQVVLPNRPWGRKIPVWEDGSLLRITGICSVHAETNLDLREGRSTPVSFRILLRSPEDVTVLQKPSWWTASHLLPVLAIVLVISLAALGWIAVLRHRIAEQTVLIQAHNATLRDLSFQDGLTGIANRRKFDETLKAEYEKAAQSGLPISLLIADIDHFKALNDELGHQQGDEWLVRVAQALSTAALRSSDLVARYGGEEFAAILPGCDQAGAFAIAERMRTAVLALSVNDAGPPLTRYVSISVGVATVDPESGADPSTLVRSADSALYEAKLHGRNRTVMAAVSSTTENHVCPTDFASRTSRCGSRQYT